MMHVVVSPDAPRMIDAQGRRFDVQLYGSAPRRGAGSIGGKLWYELGRIDAPLNPTAFDLLSLSMAVTAADTFVSRHNAPDGWAREIRLSVSLSEPQVWQPAIPILQRALRFLSGDQWTLEILGGGEPPPAFRPRSRTKISLDECDSACLYSGGLDSAIGVLNLIEQGRRPALVSHAYTGDASRQEELLRHFGPNVVRFGAQANPRAWLGWARDVQMRTRSFNFLAMGVLIATAMMERRQRGNAILFVPENALIALNPPLTNRRIGALSTRTTHPYFLALIQQIIQQVGLNVVLDNPFAGQTKGEMVSMCHQPQVLARIAHRTVSCGKWKRTRKQCGRCVPCLIRRASFNAAGLQDQTDYAASGQNLGTYLDHGSEPDDLMAMALAIRRLDTIDLEAWVAKAGPLPLDEIQKAERIDAVRRGMLEVKYFLESSGVI
jgi:hypothetical protein